MKYTGALYIGIFFCLFSAVVSAKSYEKVILKSGTILEGYISVQHPGKDLIFSSEKAIVCIPSNKIQTITNHEWNLSSLSKEWKQWADENQIAVKIVNGNRYLVLSDIELIDRLKTKNDTVAVDDSTMSISDMNLSAPDSTLHASEKPTIDILNGDIIPQKVFIIEKGVVIKYLDFTPNLYTLKWSDVRMIERERRSNTELSGLIDVITLRSGEEYKGQVIGQIPGEQIRLLKNDGIIEVIDPMQIASQKKIALNPEQDLFEQAPLLDIVYTKQGDMLKGIIVEQNYGSDKVKSYLRIEDKSGNIQRKNNDLIIEMNKEKNPSFNPIDDVVIKDNEILANRKSTTFAVIKENGNILIVDTASKATVLKADSIGNKLIVETIDSQSNRNIILLKLTKLFIKGSGLCDIFSYEDLLTKGIHSNKTSVSVNKTLKMEYPISTGNYILYKPNEKKAILLFIK